MKKQILQSGTFWLVVFLLLILLSQSNLFIPYSNQPSWLGFPEWLWWLMLIHGLYLGALYGFIKWYWKEGK